MRPETYHTPLVILGVGGGIAWGLGMSLDAVFLAVALVCWAAASMLIAVKIWQGRRRRELP
jgi:hypothetical protein